MRNVIIEKLTSCGFKVSNAGIIYKQSTKHNTKEKQLEDLKKAQWYLTKLIKEVEQEGHETN